MRRMGRRCNLRSRIGKDRRGIDELLEMVNLTADVLELKANPDRLAKVLLSRQESTRAEVLSQPFLYSRVLSTQAIP